MFGGMHSILALFFDKQTDEQSENDVTVKSIIFTKVHSNGKYTCRWLFFSALLYLIQYCLPRCKYL